MDVVDSNSVIATHDVVPTEPNALLRPAPGEWHSPVVASLAVQYGLYTDTVCNISTPREATVNDCWHQLCRKTDGTPLSVADSTDWCSSPLHAVTAPQTRSMAGQLSLTWGCSVHGEAHSSLEAPHKMVCLGHRPLSYMPVPDKIRAISQSSHMVLHQA